jgi:DNA repair exonuclease SbcCD ATPase subunit
MTTTSHAFRSGSSSHALMAGAVCPICEQPIPDERAQEIWARLEAQAETFAKAQVSIRKRRRDREG